MIVYQFRENFIYAHNAFCSYSAPILPPNSSEILPSTPHLF